MFKKLLAFLFLLILISACATNPVTGKKELVLITESQEIEMGKNFYPNALWEAEGGGGEFKDPELKKYLESIVKRLHENSHRSNLPIQFAIQNSSVPNAWAVPGYIVITRGLLANLESEAEFAYIMGHELGHVTARHSARQTTYGILAQLGLTTAGIFLSGKDYAGLALEAGSIGGTLLLLKYSRQDELEADRLGLEYMTKIGYRPENAIQAHKNLEISVNNYLKEIGKESRERGFFEDLLSTHPRSSIRIEELKSISEQYPVRSLYGDGTNRDIFLKMNERLRSINRAYIQHYDKAYRLFRENKINDADKELDLALGIDQTQPAFYTLKGLIYMKRGLNDMAEKYLKIALDLDSEYQPAIRAMGFFRYSQKSYFDAIRQFEKAIKLYPNDMVSHYFAGLSNYEAGNYRRAKDYFIAFANVFPKHEEVYGYLGFCYEKLGDIQMAYKAYSQQININPNNEIGKKSRERIIYLQKIIR
ncbi:MAG: M48 family metalloprotease [Proteobacteria bacterium]|nr:M48 family metalloprotease [Pseudomonadota bacterium]